MADSCIHIVYYRYDDDVSIRHPRWWVNWLVSKITRSPYIHTEIVFPNGSVYGILWGSSITKVTDKSYRRDRYICQEIPVNTGQIDSMIFFLEGRINEPSSFNYWGFLLLPIWPSSGASKNKWFCSELVAATLGAGGLSLDEIPPHKISPGELFNLIKSTGTGYNTAMLNSEWKPLLV